MQHGGTLSTLPGRLRIQRGRHRTTTFDYESSGRSRMDFQSEPNTRCWQLDQAVAALGVCTLMNIPREWLNRLGMYERRWLIIAR